MTPTAIDETRAHALHEVYVLLSIATRLVPDEVQTLEVLDLLLDALSVLDPLIDAEDHQLSQAALTRVMPMH